ncbi:ISNCY family transposase [Enterobacter hormaechei subsp. hoffmannii]|nr:ISNCY family transposase [Enterobacter hormaechei]MBT1923799.1 ISNCY family transposase [Enterobacter hormaechei subsp. hoffmannii]MBT1928542.1 ISNCY family transposase [Enterobacter hormaechei subsp. hoffmannii]MBT1952150.1 ISNCY family transposase [Enterobacter hormaechei subsp. hoffmannii]MBT1956551.1 ISNCY family transposase [Enterobacter hormaechei subsp. hoffmannii]MBT1966759.1 ISNCY family transposase [Enterobacter hormaechei subsp. hoffmannii]
MPSQQLTFPDEEFSVVIHDTGMFTVKEINRLKILQDVIDRNLRPGQAAEMLGITPRHCSRLLKRYRQSGPLGMNNQSRGRTGNRLLPASLTDQALNIIRERYADFGPTLAREKLAENHGIVLGKETLRRLMIKTGLWVPRKKRAPKIQQPRYRRACCGELIQIDGCDHHWFENRAPACTALVYVDDATSRLMQLRFVKSESTFTYFEATRGYLEKHGKPLALYSDKASVFRINNKNATGGDGYTQFGRAMHELNIQTICANTSSAKGRVERAHLTLQDRLVKELRLRGISSVDAANDFADEFMTDYNRRFGKAPRHDFDVHRPLETDDDLTTFFTWREPRRVSKSLTVQYDKVLYLIADSELSRRAIGKYIEVWHYPDGHKELRLNGAVLPYSTYDRLQEIDQGAIVDNKRLGRTLEFIKLVQDKRDNNRSQALPAGDGPSRRRRKPTENKSQRSLNGDDMLEALKILQSRSEEIFGTKK